MNLKHTLHQSYSAPPCSDSDVMSRLHTFLDAAGGIGFVLAGVDAADLYKDIFPKEYSAAIAKSSQQDKGKEE